MRDFNTAEIPQALEAEPPFEASVYLGPGLESIVASLSAQRTSRLVTFTATGTVRSAHSQTSGPDLPTTAHPALVAHDTAEMVLRSFNMTGFGSIRDATGLRQIFPGLRNVSQTPVDTLSPQDALAKIELTAGHNLLILGATGYEDEVLTTLFALDGSPLFSRIILPLPSISLYDGSADGTTLKKRLEAACYRRIWSNTSDPDLPIAAFDLDTARLTLVQRDQEITVLDERLARLTTDLTDLRTQRDAALTKTETFAQLEATVAANKQEIAKLTGELHEALTKEDAASTALKGARSEIGVLTETLNQKTAAYTTLEADYKNHVTQRDAQSEELKTAEAARQALAIELDEAKSRAAAQLEEAQKSNALTTTKLEEKTAAYEALKAKHNTTQEQFGSLNQGLEQVTKEKADLASKLTAQYEAFAELEVTAKEYEARCAALSQDLDNVKSQASTHLEEAQQKASDLAAELSARDATIKDLSAQAEQNGQDAATHKQALEALQASHDAAQETLQTVQAENESLQASVQSLTEQAEQAQTANTQLANQLEQSQKNTATKAAEVRDIAKARDTYQADMALAVRVQNLREADLADLRGQYAQLQDKNTHLTKLLQETYHALRFLEARQKTPKSKPKKK